MTITYDNTWRWWKLPNDSQVCHGSQIIRISCSHKLLGPTIQNLWLSGFVAGPEILHFGEVPKWGEADLAWVGTILENHWHGWFLLTWSNWVLLLNFYKINTRKCWWRGKSPLIRMPAVQGEGELVSAKTPSARSHARATECEGHADLAHWFPGWAPQQWLMSGRLKKSPEATPKSKSLTDPQCKVPLVTQVSLSTPFKPNSVRKCEKLLKLGLHRQWSVHPICFYTFENFHKELFGEKVSSASISNCAFLAKYDLVIGYPATTCPNHFPTICQQSQAESAHSPAASISKY